MVHRVALVLGVLALLGLPRLAFGQQWGTIKGQVVWSEKELPQRPALKVDKDQAACLKNGPLLADEFVVDAKSKGVRWVVLWLVDATDLKAPLPIHPDLKTIPDKDKKVVVDQPCCQFEPHVIALREGQVLVAKNSATIPHNVKIDGGVLNPNLNQLLPPGTSLDIDGWKGLTPPVPVSCSIHGWMKSYVRVYNHPYFAVTNEKGEFEIKNAPAGKYNMVIWHESGYVKGDKRGVPITINVGGVTDLGKIEMKKPKDD